MLENIHEVASRTIGEQYIRHLVLCKLFKGIDMVKSWPGPRQKYNLLYSTASTHPVSLCS